MTLFKNMSMSALVAGFIATVISYAGPLVIIFQAAHKAGLPAEVLSSWIWAISIGSGVLGIALSLCYRAPVVIAWSAPGSALLVSLLPQVSLGEAVGAYLVANLIVLVVGLSGAFDKVVARLPLSVCAAMLAGILFSFGSALFTSLQEQPLLVLAMFVTYLVCKRLSPRYSVLAVLLVGVGLVVGRGELSADAWVIGLATPVWITPEFSLTAMLNIGVPLAVVALTGQFIPGMALLRSSGYGEVPALPLLAGCGLGSLLLAPFACHGLALGAITAAICTGREAHERPERRYVAGVVGGLFYLLFGLFGATLVSLFTAFPQALVAALAGLALFGAISASLAGAMAVPQEREAALVAFLVTASGMSFLGLSAAFWGLIFGLFAHWLLTHKTAHATEQVVRSRPAQETR